MDSETRKEYFLIVFFLKKKKKREYKLNINLKLILSVLYCNK